MGGPPRVGPGRLSVAGRKAGPKVGSAPCNPPLMGWQALDAGPRGDCVACMPCGAWVLMLGPGRAVEGMKKQGAGVQPPVCNFFDTARVRLYTKILIFL